MATNASDFEPWRARDRAENRLYNAWYASLISGLAAILLTAWAASSSLTERPTALAVSVDGVLTIVLGWITQRYRSRVAACLLTVRSAAFGSSMLIQGHVIAGLLTVLVFTPAYFLGFLGARFLHRQRPARSARGKQGIVVERR